MRHRSFRKRLFNTGERKSIFCNNVSRDEEEESHAMGVAKMHVSARREPIAFWGNSRISPLCHFWRLSTVTRTKIRSAIFARNVVDSNETSRPLPAIRSARSFLFPKSNENRPFSNSEVCSGLLLRDDFCVAFFVVVVVVVVVVLDVSRQFPAFQNARFV